MKRGLEGILGSQIDQEDLTLETRKHLYQEGSKGMASEYDSSNHTWFFVGIHEPSENLVYHFLDSDIA